MKKYIFLLLAICSIVKANAQNTLKGTITNSNDSNPLSASIYIPILEKGTIADFDGNYIITNIPNGRYDIIYSLIGYASFSKTLTFSENTIVIEDVSLEQIAIEMEEVIISTPFHKLQRDNVMKVERISAKKLSQISSTNLSEGITEIPGVSTISTGTSIGKPVIRGLSSNRVLVYAQGIRLENQQFGSEHGLGLNDSGVESIEVIKGPASLLYGSDAIGGVLYVNPEKFASSNESNASASFNYLTNTEGINTNLGYKTSTDNFKFLIRAGITEHADYKTNLLRVTNTRFKEQDIKAAIGYQASNFSTDFRYNLTASQFGIPEEIGIQELSKELLLPKQKIDNHIFSSKSKLFFNNSSLVLNVGYIYNDRKEFEEHHEHDEDEDHEGDEDDEDEDHEGEDEHEDEDPALHMKLKTFNYDLKYNLPRFGIVETIVGVQGMHQTNTNYGEEELIPNATTNDFGVFATSHLHFTSVDVQLGVRYDNRAISLATIDKSFDSFNGAIGVKKNFGDNFITRLNIASGFRAPNLAELTSDGIHHGTNRYEIGNINLSYEQNIQFDLALEYTTEHVEIFTNGFYNTINDYIFISPTDLFIDDTLVYQYIQEDAYLYGGEIGLHLHPHPLDWLHIESSFENVTGKKNNDEYLPLIPANTIKNTLRVEFKNNKLIENSYAFIRYENTLNQNNISEFETETKGYNLLNFGAGTTFKLNKVDLDTSFYIANITNENYIAHLSRLKSEGIPNMGRNFSFTVKASI